MKNKQMAKLLKGKPVADRLFEEIQAEAEKYDPTLAIVRVGDDDGSKFYQGALNRKCEDVGVTVRNVEFEESISEGKLIEAIRELNEDASISGILLMEPLPSHICGENVTDVIAPKKDVDCITAKNVSKLYLNREAVFSPSTARSCIEILKFYDIDLTGKNVVVVGRSLVIGKPVSLMLSDRNATVTIAHSKTKDLPSLTKSADIVIFATGRANAYGTDYVSPGQIIIDVGTNTGEDGKITGDVDFDAVEPIVDAITPVPGGVGSSTTAVTLYSVLEAAKIALK